MDAASLIVAVRRRRGMTQAELALRAGTSQPVVSTYERGLRDPSTRTLRRLVEASGERLVLDARAPSEERMTPDGDQAHAERLADLLALVDALPPRPRGSELLAPRLVSR